MLEVSLIPLSLSHLTVTLPEDCIGSTFKFYQLFSHSRPLPPQPQPLSLLQETSLVSLLLLLSMIVYSQLRS